jgi:hypothetical protein
MPNAVSGHYCTSTAEPKRNLAAYEAVSSVCELGRNAMVDTSSEVKSLPLDELDSQLDDALEHTFPASDPVSVGEPTSNVPERPIGRRPALIDKDLVDELAEKVAGKLRKRS